jgi:hypothetical protein
MKCFVPSKDLCSLKLAGCVSNKSTRFFSLSQTSVDFSSATRFATSIASKAIFVAGSTLTSDSSNEICRSLSSKLPVVKSFSATSAAADKLPGFRCNHDCDNLKAR